MFASPKTLLIVSFCFHPFFQRCSEIPFLSLQLTVEGTIKLKVISYKEIPQFSLSPSGPLLFTNPFKTSVFRLQDETETEMKRLCSAGYSLDVNLFLPSHFVIMNYALILF
jgi:hypothetical protein